MLEHIFETLRPDEQIYVWSAKPRHERKLLDSVEDVYAFAEERKQETDVYFGVCPRVRGELDTPSRATVLWADFDTKGFNNSFSQTERAIAAFPLLPTFVVKSGHGYHVYWLLDRSIQPREAQEILRPLCAWLGADATHDPTRVLRVPNTLNHKEKDAIELVELAGSAPERAYDPQEIARLANVTHSVANHIRDGEIEETRNGRTYKLYKSRSERDWEIMRHLTGLGLTKETIRLIFEQHPKIAGRYIESNWRLFNVDLEKSAGSITGATLERFTEIEERLYFNTSKGRYQIASFVYHPERLLEDPTGQLEDAFIGTIHADGKAWEGVVFPKSCFSSASAFIKSLPSMYWSWHASDVETKQYQDYLLGILKEGGMKHSFGTDVVGRHDRFWVTPDYTLSKDQEFPRNEAPYAYLPLQASKTLEVDGTVASVRYPDCSDDAYRTLVQELSQYLPTTNAFASTTALMGWFFAAPFKSLLKQVGVRFPLLNVYGTQGSGKTSSLLQLYMPLLGVKDPKTWTPNTTTFVIRKLLGGTNSIPVIFGEFRVSTTRGLRSDFLRVLLMSYDSGVDARGRADLSAETYRLEAPIIIDGEDALADPAARERSILVSLHPEDIRDGTTAQNHFQKVRSLPLENFARRYIQRTLTETPASVLTRYEQALAYSNTEVTITIPERVRNNLAVILMGLSYYNEWVTQWGGTPVVWTGELFEDILNDVIRMLSVGVSRIVVDGFIEDMLLEASEKKRADIPFPIFYDANTNIVWFPLHAVFRWWEREQRMRGRDVLEMYSLQNQLLERSKGAGYAIPQTEIANSNIGTVYCFGVSLDRARQFKLQVPSKLSPSTLQQRSGSIISTARI